MMNLDNSVYPWLVQALNNPGRNQSYRPSGEEIDCVKSLLVNEKATAFLIVWSIMERELFRAEANPTEIKNFASRKASLYSYLAPTDTNNGSFDSVAKFFHDCYKNDPERRRKLLGNRQATRDFTRILNIAEFSFLSNEDKMYLLLYVTFRYRNNIFHGNKHIKDWLNFSEQIEDCIEFMMALIDAYHKHPCNNS